MEWNGATLLTCHYHGPAFVLSPEDVLVELRPLHQEGTVENIVFHLDAALVESGLLIEQAMTVVEEVAPMMMGRIRST